MAVFLGIEIGGTKLQLFLGDESAKILERKKLPVDTVRGGAGIREQIQRALPELIGSRKLQVVGVGFGGPVDWRTGRICRSHQIEGWSEFDLSNWLHAQLGVPVMVDNDANLGALGEALHGEGVGFNPIFYVTLGSGVGGGLVVDGRVYHGTTPGESEIGHVRLDRQGTIVENRCSGWAVDKRIRELQRSRPDSILAKAAGTGGEAKHLQHALNQGDAAAQQILKETATDLAFGLSHVVHLFHPAIIILGGGLSGVGEPLRAAVQSALGQYVMEAFQPELRVCLASLGEDAVPVGALELARQTGRRLQTISSPRTTASD
jgi:glucokinase